MNVPNERAVITVLTAPGVDRPTGIDEVEARADVRFTDTDGLADALSGADALLLWDFFSTAVRDVWSAASSLRWIHVAAAGVDKLLFDELRESDVVVTNARGVFDRPIAEFVLASIMAQAKDIHTSHDHQRERRWQHRETRTVVGETALVVGTGAIGRETARLLSAVGMQVRGAGRTARSGDSDFGDVVASGELAQHVGWADHVIIATPLTAQTRGLIDASVLEAMKPTAHLVNIGRGESVDEEALLDALDSGGIAAASLDVFCTEPLPDDSRMWTAPGLVVSPHMSGDVLGWRETLSRQFVDNAHRFLDGESLANVVDKRLGFVPADTSRSTRG